MFRLKNETEKQIKAIEGLGSSLFVTREQFDAFIGAFEKFADDTKKITDTLFIESISDPIQAEILKAQIAFENESERILNEVIPELVNIAEKAGLEPAEARAKAQKAGNKRIKALEEKLQSEVTDIFIKGEKKRTDKLEDEKEKQRKIIEENLESLKKAFPEEEAMARKRPLLAGVLFGTKEDLSKEE